MAKVRGVRFTEQEEKLISEFLLKNPFFDFSTLAKVSILDFIRKPQLNFNAVGNNIHKDVKDVRSN